MQSDLMRLLLQKRRLREALLAGEVVGSASRGCSGEECVWRGGMWYGAVVGWADGWTRCS